jgi:hypothetical protein
MPDSQHDCYAVLEETLGLAHVNSLPLKSQQRLDHLLVSYFQNDEGGARFRSMLCYGRDDQLVSPEAFNEFAVLPRSDYSMELHSSTVNVSNRFHRISPTERKELQLHTLNGAQASVDFVLAYLIRHADFAHQDIVYFHDNHEIPRSWKNAILALSRRATLLKIIDAPSLEDLQFRIRASLDFSCAQKIKNGKSQFFCEESGWAWKTNASNAAETIDYQALYLKGCSEFPAHLAELLGPDQYLDQLAGVVDLGHPNPDVVARFQQMYDQAPARHVDKHDLLLGKDNPEIGGTVLALHQFISPLFLAHYTMDHDACCSYMMDERSSQKKNRKIRVASLDHVDTLPTWLQFGETTDVYLYLSQKASAAEEKWLQIVNYVMNLLVKFVNSRIKEEHGGSTRKFELMRKRDYRVAVGSASNPIEGNFGWHQDGKNGIVAIGDANYSTFQLMVPTFCLQNYSHPNTKIEWAPISEPTFIAGVVTQECILVHIQLLGVNEKFRHHVSIWFAPSPVLCSAFGTISFTNYTLNHTSIPLHSLGLRLKLEAVPFPRIACSTLV